MLPEDLFATAAAAALRAGRVPPDLIDTVNIGQTVSVSLSGMSPRHAALKAGIAADKPVLGVRNMSGTGLSTLINSAQEILIGAASISLAGGMEALSSIPLIVRNIRFKPLSGRKIELEDKIRLASFDTYMNMYLIEAVDEVARKYGITREEVDRLALKSHQKWKNAHDSGVFDAELAPVNLNDEEVIACDENPRPDSTLEVLSKLRAAEPGGACTAGNVASFSDGAGALIVASEEAVRRHNLTPLSRLVAWSRVNVEPRMMAVALVPAVQALLKATEYTIDDIDLVEMHENFGVAVLASAGLLKVDEGKVNVNGGAIAVGHPAGASGIRLVAHLTHELRRRGLGRAIAAMSGAGGQGIAVMLEACPN
ncbi:unnamed protein product [Chrysodeixis includens]|uniref:Acetyl-CoA acetyltransferase n=1 Tax=Chrysodeixis includens TaxID=689277 RepID=A0A9P0BRL5_CHRIL|nr:unnamed protein product [Chrysodeixis includens]